MIPVAFFTLIVANVLACYDTRILETGITFLPENNGVWTMGDFSGDGELNLIHMKTRDTPNGHVEVHIASQASNIKRVFLKRLPYSQAKMMGLGRSVISVISPVVQDQILSLSKLQIPAPILSRSTSLQLLLIINPSAFGPENNGVWTMADTTGNGKLGLVYIETRSTGTGNIEAHITSATSDYEARIVGTLYSRNTLPPIAPSLCWLHHTNKSVASKQPVHAWAVSKYRFLLDPTATRT
jgi:hypothetical protein